MRDHLEKQQRNKESSKERHFLGSCPCGFFEWMGKELEGKSTGSLLLKEKTKATFKGPGTYHDTPCWKNSVSFATILLQHLHL